METDARPERPLDGLLSATGRGRGRARGRSVTPEDFEHALAGLRARS